MVSQPVRLGPFVGGLNNISTAGESKDEEVTELVNYELALDTSLVSRPPIEPLNTINTANNWTVHGIYRVTAADWYVIASQPSTNADQWFLGAWAKGDMSSTRISIKTLNGVANQVTGFVQYNDYGYFLTGPDSTIKGFRWKNGGTASDITNMPKGTSLASWKDRLWVTGSQIASTGNYIWFSTVDATGAKPDTWNTTTDFINIDPGSGGLNTALLPLTSSILIFKEDATYRFAFPNAPKNGEVVNLSRQIGAAGPTSVIGFENYAFVYDQGRVYELINTKFTQINMGVDLSKSSAPSVDSVALGVDLSVVSRRLIVRYYTNVYAYSVDTRTWTQWQSYAGTPGKFIELPGDSSSASPSVFYAGMTGATQLPGENRIYDPQFQDEENSANIASAVTQNGIASIENGALTITSTTDSNTYVSLGKYRESDVPLSGQQTISFSIEVESFTKANESDSIIGMAWYKKLDGTEVGGWFYPPFRTIQTNLCINPGTVTADGYNKTANMGTILVGGPYSSAGNRMGLRSVASAASSGYNSGFNCLDSLIPAGTSVGDTVSVSLWVFVTKASSINFGAYLRDGSGATVPNTNNGNYTNVPANTWTRLSATTLPTTVATGKSVYFYCYSNGFVSGDSMYINQVIAQYNKTDTVDFFDGETPSENGYTYEWTGTANASRSITKIRDLKKGLNTFSDLVVPNGAYLAAISIGVNRAGNSVTFRNPNLTLANTKSPAGIAKFVDGYINTGPKELIKCHMKTKAFDYQAAAVFKRLFLWGVDIVTTRSIEMKAIPLGKTAAVTWTIAGKYTWDQLAQGTWANPLSWKNVSKTITDTTGPFADVSENGRFFVKALKALRFRQIQFEVNTSTLGNAEVGPVKLFTLTTYTKAGQFVTDKAT